MGRTSTAKSSASATNQKGSAKKASTKSELEKVKKSIEMVVKKGSGDKSNSASGA